MNTRGRQAFTLVELVIVIAILGILAAIAIPRFIDIRSEAYIAQRDGIVGSARAGILTVAAKNQVGGGAGTFPPSLEADWNGIGSGGSQPIGFPEPCAPDACFELIIPGGYLDANWEQTTATSYTFTAPVGTGTKLYTYTVADGTLR